MTGEHAVSDAAFAVFEEAKRSPTLEMMELHKLCRSTRASMLDDSYALRYQ
jgi:hypothetical protein